MTGDKKSVVMQSDVGVAGGVQPTLTFDATPTAGSTNPVTSAGILAALQDKVQRIYVDVSNYTEGTGWLDSGYILEIPSNVGFAINVTAIWAGAGNPAGVMLTNAPDSLNRYTIYAKSERETDFGITALGATLSYAGYGSQQFHLWSKKTGVNGFDNIRVQGFYIKP